LQRLFSTFASGRPGVGLLIQRLATGAGLFYEGIAQLGAPTGALMFAHMAGAVLGLFIVIGLWTPVTGALVAVVELWILIEIPGDVWMPLTLAVLGITLALIGPGAWSIDAFLFGRKHIAG